MVVQVVVKWLSTGDQVVIGWWWRWSGGDQVAMKWQSTIDQVMFTREWHPGAEGHAKCSGMHHLLPMVLVHALLLPLRRIVQLRLVRSWSGGVAWVAVKW